MTVNPVLRKDLLGLLRLKRFAAIQLLFVLALGAAVLLGWPRGGVMSMSARSSDDLLMALVMGQAIVMILAVPGLAAVSITGEREALTLEMLYASRLTAVQIVIGKVLSAISFPVLLMISALPFLGLLNFRGAVDTNVLVWAYLVLISTAVLLAILSLTVSAYCGQSATALVAAYLITLGAAGALLVPGAIMLGAAGGYLAAVLHYVRGLSPVAAILSLLRPDLAGDYAGKTIDLVPLHTVFPLAAAGVSIVCLLLLANKLRKPPSEATATPAGKKLRPGKRFGHGNPVMAKEARTSTLRSVSWMIRIFYGMFVLSLLLSLMSLSAGAEHADLLRYVFQVLVSFQLVGIAAVTPSLTTPAISGEIEANTFESLRLSRLTGGKIFWGKLLPAFLPAFLPIIALLPAYGTLCYVNPSYLSYLLYVMPVAVLAMALCCVMGLACSVFAGSTPRATVIAYLAVAAIMVIPLLAWWAADAGVIGNSAWVQWISMPSALAVGLSLAPTSMAGGTVSSAGSGIAQLRNTHEMFTAGLCLLLLIVARLKMSSLLKHGAK